MEVEYQRDDGTIAGDHVRLIDFDDPDNNDWLAVNQFTIVENGNNRRPDVIVFVNGLPLGLIELKNLADDDATIDKAYDQLRTYKQEIPSLFDYNEVCVISDGRSARIGSFTAGFEWFKPWRTIDGENPGATIGGDGIRERLGAYEVQSRGLLAERAGVRRADLHAPEVRATLPMLELGNPDSRCV